MALDDTLAQDEPGRDLIDLLQVVADNLRLLVLAPVGVAVLAFAVTFAIAPTYTAIATFLPPQQQQSMASSVLQSLGSLGGLAGAATGLKNPTDQFVSFLKSNAVEDELVQRFGLMDRYEAKFKGDARKQLEKNTRIAAGKDNIVTVEFDDHDPAFAAQVANAYPEELTRLLGRLAITEAQQRRVFFGKQLAETKDRLVAAEQALAATGVSVATLNANPATALEGPARLRAQVTAQEVKLASMRSFLTEAAPEFRQAQAELAALRKELARAETAQPASSTNGVAGGNDYIAKYRDFKYQETLLELFSRQYELARVDESREGAVVQSLDAAQPPEHKSKPRRAIVAAVAGAGSFLLLLIFIFARRSWLDARADGQSAERIERLSASWRRALGRG
ncbi:lipopolysaccharide biosynthesis protein [Xylophilus rhododendri]|uniref:Lipopolysaccharide biosynthesis protein n=1 Tax=Xylophilus rhododendri TaxID=2697032 RepID=A0A857JCF5_9BURK|nr:lipopolysaccharide biosynthesis protein [Xylophilus rhododendri]